jgi:glycosyltransferase involved in cell wall biosynthesis
MRLADYQGRNLERFAGVISLVEEYQPKTVIGLGQHSIMMLRALSRYTDVRKVWYAADELMYFQLSCMRREGFSTLKKRLELLTLYGGLETFFVRGMDGAIGVAPQEAKLLKYLAGAKRTTCIRNGVDTEFFAPPMVRPRNKQLVFWGRMDFEPNIDAVTWFCQSVWPQLHAKHPDAVFKVVGKNPTPAIEALNTIDGVEIVGSVPDIRPYVNDSSATVMPMRCGGGIKNKLLEAAAMGIPIIGSPKAVLGLEAKDGALPVLTCKSSSQWIDAIENLWSNVLQSQKLSIELRQWVLSHHSWPNAARQMLHWLDRLPCVDGHACRHTPLTDVHVMQNSVLKEAA